MSTVGSPSTRSAAVLAACASLLLGACTDGGEAPAPETRTATVTTTAGTPQGLAATPSEPGSRPEREETCGVDTQAAAIQDNLWQVPAPQAPGEGWEYYGQSNYDPCADLSYALVWVTGSAHPLKQSQLMLFHRGDYLGVGALAPQSMYVEEAGPDSVRTRVVDFEAMERNQAPGAEAELYRSDLTFWWNGERVEAVGRIPNQGAVSLPH